MWFADLGQENGSGSVFETLLGASLERMQRVMKHGRRANEPVKAFYFCRAYVWPCICLALLNSANSSLRAFRRIALIGAFIPIRVLNRRRVLNLRRALNLTRVLNLKRVLHQLCRRPSKPSPNESIPK